MRIFKYVLKNNKQGVMEINADNPWKARAILKKIIRESKILTSKSSDWILCKKN